MINKAIVPGEKPRVEHLIAEGDDIHGGGHSDQRGFKRMLVRDQFTRALIKRKYVGCPLMANTGLKLQPTQCVGGITDDWGELDMTGQNLRVSEYW